MRRRLAWAWFLFVALPGCSSLGPVIVEEAAAPTCSRSTAPVSSAASWGTFAVGATMSDVRAALGSTGLIEVVNGALAWTFTVVNPDGSTVTGVITWTDDGKVATKTLF